MRAAVHTWLVEPLDDEIVRVVERITHAPDVRAVAVMPDVHLAGDVCVGMAIGTRGASIPLPSVVISAAG